ncbi:MAG: epoxyqueuosine reductase [Spirochaetales bacterium]|nr:epoxyqueuosine reductase [Spirochaetales bacterium]
MTTLPLPATVNSEPDFPFGLIAPFASADYYREAINRLKPVRSYIAGMTGTTAKKIRLFSNSQLPEKSLAVLCGLGSIGRNSLLVCKNTGTQHILCGLVLPDVITRLPNPELHNTDICGNCNACIKNCPTGALQPGGIFDRAKCIQDLMPKHVMPAGFMREAWSNRIYGCQNCQDCCPYNRNNISGFPFVKTGYVGQQIQLSPLLEYWLSGKDIRDFFAGCALHARWMDQRAFVRNAIIAAANKNYHTLVPLLRKTALSEDTVISQISLWALSKIT